MPFQFITSKRLKDPEDMGVIFNNFLIVVTEHLITWRGARNILLSEEFFPWYFPGLKIIPATER